MPTSKMLVLAALGLIAPLGFCQVDTGTITGTITDASSAAVPDVQVLIVETSTNFTSKATTNSDGIYRVQSLKPGTYRLTFEASGFKRFVRDGITLGVGAVQAVDVALEVGSVTDSVEVSAQASLLQTESSSTGAVTSGAVLNRMPLYQRAVSSTLLILPGAAVTNNGNAGNFGTYSVGGQRSSGTAVFEDGVFGVDPQGGGTISPIQNALEEVKILTSALPAEYGHSAGGVVSVVKKGGTNTFHGMAQDFGRTRRMTHRQYFSQYKTSQPQPGAPDGVMDWFQQPDFSFSGPVLIPRLYNGRNKTFFAVSHQRLIEKKATSFTNLTPTLDELQGDFTFGGLGNPLYDPSSTRQLDNGTWTRDPFPSRILPKSRLDPVARKIGQDIDPWAPPNLPGSFTSTGPVSNYAWQAKSRTFNQQTSVRIDHQFSQNLKLYGSYTVNAGRSNPRYSNITIPDFDGGTGPYAPTLNQNYSTGVTYVLSPTAVNDARIGYYRGVTDTQIPSYGKDWGATLGIPNISPLLMPAFGASFPSNQANTGPLSSIYGLTVTGPSKTIRETLSFRDDFSKFNGVHAFKMGYEVLDFRANYWQVGQPSGTFAFDTMTAGLQASGQAVPNTGNDFAGFLLGAVRSATFSTYTTTWLPRDKIHSLYFQDDWKVSRNLTLNLGLRWSTESPFHTAHGLQSNFNATAIDPLTGKTGAIVHPAGGLNERTLRDFQPRAGVAWHPLKEWVFRGGFGINTIDIRWPNALEQFDEYNALNVQQRAPGDPRPLFQLSNGPAPVHYNTLPDGSALYVGTNYGSRNVTWMDSQLRPGYAMNWNMTTEFQPRTNTVVKMTYQGSAGVRLVESWNVNVFPTDFGANDPKLRAAAFAATQNYLPFPQFGRINYMSNTGHSTFHSATVQYEQRYTHGLVLSSFYTFAKAIDDCDNDSGVCTGVAPVTNRNLSKGRASFDQSHRFVTSATYELPVGKGRHFMNRGGILNVLFGGYEIAWIQSFVSGNPLSFSYINSPNNYYPTLIGNWVPDVNGKPALRDGWRDMGGNRFNQALINAIIPPSFFSAPAAFTLGDAGRNIVSGTGMYSSQGSAKKIFKLTERIDLQLRFDFQNMFHNYNFNPPSTVLDFKNPQLFGKLTTDVPTVQTNSQPLMNLALRLSW